MAFEREDAVRIVERTCCLCRSRDDKLNLARMVVGGGDLIWDKSHRLPGRGGYVHITPRCASRMSSVPVWERALRLRGGTLAAEQVAEVARAVMECALSVTASGNEDGRSVERNAGAQETVGKRGTGGKKVRL